MSRGSGRNRPTGRVAEFGGSTVAEEETRGGATVLRTTLKGNVLLLTMDEAYDLADALDEALDAAEKAL